MNIKMLISNMVEGLDIMMPERHMKFSSNAKI